MAKVNEIKCASAYKNVGFGTCIFDPKQIAGALLFPDAKTFTQQEITNLQTTLANMAKADSKTARMYPLHRFVAISDNTEDVTVQTFDYGAKFIVRDGDYDASFQYLDGALCLHTALRTFNGPTPFLLYDKKGVIIGSRTSAGLLKTIEPHFFYAMPWKFATGSTATAYMVRFCFTPEQVNDYLGFVKADFDLNDIKGLKDVEVVVNSYNEGTGVANVTLQTLCNKVNLYDNLSTELAQAANFVASNKEDGGLITVSNVATGTGKTFDVTLNTADGEYPAAGGVILLNLAAVSVMEGNDITGYEGVEAEIALAAS